ncbi:MAG: YaeQ family protein [Pseudomonadota bacterium]
MALKATIFRAELQVSDLDRHYYQTHSLTLARHPSETDERLMLRVLAFARHAHPDLAFTKGLSSQDEPDLWRKDMTGAIDNWIELGQPDEKRIRKACGRASQVYVYSYGGHAAELWWEKNRPQLDRFKNLTVINLPRATSASLEKLAQRNMRLNCTVQDKQLWLADENHSVDVEMTVWQQA